MNAAATNHIRQTEIRLDEHGNRIFNLKPTHTLFKNGHTTLVKCSTCKGAKCAECDYTGKMEIQF